jgi:hypothetical protein
LPLPVKGKAPPIPGWQHIQPTGKIIDTWSERYPDALNTGVLTRSAPCIDIDVADEEVAEEIEKLAEGLLGKSAVRIGRAPKRAMLFRTDAPFRKLSTTFTSQSGHIHKVEVLSDGQQVVVNGIHPETQRPYTWHGGEPGPDLKHEQLPLLTAEKAAEFISMADCLVRRRRPKPLPVALLNG